MMVESGMPAVVVAPMQKLCPLNNAKSALDDPRACLSAVTNAHLDNGLPDNDVDVGLGLVVPGLVVAWRPLVFFSIVRYRCCDS